jgi:branched-chain amino acid transport system substrate-binding protein
LPDPFVSRSETNEDGQQKEVAMNANVGFPRRVALLIFSFACLHATAQPATSDNSILVGQSAGFTGGQAEYSKDVKEGIEAYFATVNKDGGINGRQIKLLPLDDQGKKDQTLVNTKKLVEEQKVTALIGYTSGGGVIASLPYLQEVKVPMLSPATGNVQIREKFHRYLFHTRAGYTDEMRKMMGDMARIGLTRFATVVLGDAGPSNPAMMVTTLKSLNLAPVAAIELDRNSTDFKLQIEQLIAAKPEVVVFITNGKPLVNIVQGMRSRGYAGQFATSSFSGVKVIEDLKQSAPGLIMAQVLPAPDRAGTKVTTEFAQHLKEYRADAKPNYTNLEGYIAARTLVEGLKRAGPKAGRQKLVEGLEGMKKVDLGGYEIKFSSKNHDGSQFVDTAIVNLAGALKF